MAKLNLTDALRAEYNQLFETCTINAARQKEVEKLVGSLAANQGRYEAAGKPLGIPWFFVAVTHNMESSQSFKKHLHNGDPLTARTKQIPKNRPSKGSPPFTWEESAADALSMHSLDKWKDWSVAGTLYQLEIYNGIGYRLYHPHVKTPYLWSFTNHYKSGKYVADGTWSESAVSQQCGAAALLRRMIEKKLIGFSDEKLPPLNKAPLVVAYAAKKPTNPEVIAKATELQKWLTTHTGIFLKPDGWPGKNTSDAYKIVTGKYLPGDPRA
jgi:lysozyme family protein